MSVDHFRLFCAKLSEQLGSYWKALFFGINFESPVEHFENANTFFEKVLIGHGYISRYNVSFLLWMIVRNASFLPEKIAQSAKVQIIEFNGNKPWEPIERINRATMTYDEIPGHRRFLNEYQKEQQKQKQPSPVDQVQQSLEEIQRILQRVKTVFAKEKIDMEYVIHCIDLFSLTRNIFHRVLTNDLKETDLPGIGITDSRSIMITLNLMEMVKKLNADSFT